MLWLELGMTLLPLLLMLLLPLHIPGMTVISLAGLQGQSRHVVPRMQHGWQLGLLFLILLWVQMLRRQRWRRI